MKKIIPHLWFNTEAEETATLYVSVFRDGRIGDITRYGNEGTEITGKPEGDVMTVEFSLFGQDFIALNGGPQFTFNEAISLLVPCDTQEEIDDLWDKLTADGGQEGPCGWLKDKFGLSWQIAPAALSQMIQDPDQAKADKVMKAMLGMKKLDIAALEAAAEQ